MRVGGHARSVMNQLVHFGGPKMEPKGTQMEPRRDQKEAEGDQKGAKGEPKWKKIDQKCDQKRVQYSNFTILQHFGSQDGTKREPKGNQKETKGEPKRAPVDSRLGYRHLPMALTSWGNYGQVQNENRLKATSFKNKRKPVKSDIV